MQAVRLTAWERPARLVEVPVPEPGPGEVLVQVAAAGLCHSDLHLMHWPAGALPYELPFTLGHEVAGTVAALGAGADGLEPGEPVLVYGPWGCGRCRSCSVGAEHLCERPPMARGAGLGRDGGLADYVVVPSPRLTVPLDGLAGGTFPMRFGGVPLETSVIYSNWGTRSELAEVVELARDGAISMEIERISLGDVPAAYERLAAGGGRGRLVAVPDQEPWS